MNFGFQPDINIIGSMESDVANALKAGVDKSLIKIDLVSYIS